MFRQLLKFKEAILYTVIIFGTFVWLLSQIIPNIAELIRTEQNIKKRTVELEKVTAKLEKIREEARSNQKEEEDRIKTIYTPEISFDSQEVEYLPMEDDIVNMLKDNGIKLYSIDYNYNVKSDEIVLETAGKYLGCKLTLAIIGNYNQIKNLLVDLIKYPYLITINKIEIEPYPKDSSVLLSVLKLTLYIQQP